MTSSNILSPDNCRAKLNERLANLQTCDIPSNPSIRVYICIERCKRERVATPPAEEFNEELRLDICWSLSICWCRSRGLAGVREGERPPPARRHDSRSSLGVPEPGRTIDAKEWERERAEALNEEKDTRQQRKRERDEKEEQKTNETTSGWRRWRRIRRGDERKRRNAKRKTRKKERNSQTIKRKKKRAREEKRRGTPHYYIYIYISIRRTRNECRENDLADSTGPAHLMLRQSTWTSSQLRRS